MWRASVVPNKSACGTSLEILDNALIGNGGRTVENVDLDTPKFCGEGLGNFFRRFRTNV
jgi:hypothetical protein